MTSTAAAAVVSPGELQVDLSQQGHDEEPHRRTSFEALGVLGVDGEKKKVAEKAHRVYAPRSFEQPTETFSRKTGMRDKGPPGYEYNDTEHLSVGAVAKSGAPGSAVFLAASDSRGSSALPGVRVRSYPTSPTRDDRLDAAEAAARARAGQARRIAVKAKRDRHIRLAKPSGRTGPGQPGESDATSSSPNPPLPRPIKDHP